MKLIERINSRLVTLSSAEIIFQKLSVLYVYILVGPFNYLVHRLDISSMFCFAGLSIFEWWHGI